MSRGRGDRADDLVVPERAELTGCRDLAVVGEVTMTGELRAFWDDEVVGAIPARLLTDECPRYDVDREAPATPTPSWTATYSPSEPNLASKEWVYRQYDQLVGSRTVRRPGLDAAVLRLRPSLRGLAVSLQGPRLGERDPYRAGLQAVFGAALNVACAGGEPLALTDCLNFGNPEKPEIAWELERAIEAIAQAAESPGIPVVSGNVSLYNETDGRAIPPTPVVGCVGLVADVRYVPTGWREGDVIVVARADGLKTEAALIRFVAPACPPCSRSRTTSVTAASRGRSSRPRSGAASAPRWRSLTALACARLPARTCRQARGRVRADRSRGRLRALRQPARRASRGLGGERLDVRRLRHPLARTRRRAHRVLRALRLQHRGQESAGIAVSDRGRITALREMGLVSQVFSEEKLRGLRGELAIGHTRYSTTGSTHWANAQPIVHNGRARTVALGHNGNLTNAAELREELAERGIRVHSTSDSEMIAALIAHDDAPLEEAVARTMRSSTARSRASRSRRTG